MLPELFQEIRELGLFGTAYRLKREARVRSGLAALFDDTDVKTRGGLERSQLDDDARMGAWTGRTLFAPPADVTDLRDRIPEVRREELRDRALRATRGKILCFSRWEADYGHPLDWHLNPTNGRRWNPDRHWSLAIADGPFVGDVKLTWEVGRFPQAYAMARAATLGVAPMQPLADALDQQIRSFVSNNAYHRGVHWNSGQEIAFRTMAFTFAVGAFAGLGAELSSLPAFVARAVYAAAITIEEEIGFSLHAIYNNHLISEALGLVVAAWMLPPCAATARWRALGTDILDEQAERQVYGDGAYIQQSHNYHRVAMHDYLWACAAARSEGRAPSARWLRAMDRSLDFLVAHQNPDDGWLPNYGSNDGALPSPLASTDFPDFRPTLQAVSVVARGERLYEPGPWDEAAVWLAGRAAFESAPLRPPSRRSIAFRETGYHVLRGRAEHSFACFRCGTLKDRFGQIDMLHLDVFWRGRNVLVDPGSYQYNEADPWHSHFLRTESHNTLKVDGHDQMLHFRQFKFLYWTRAKLLAFEDRGDVALCSGEHYGFERHPGRCVHRRTVLFVKDDLWVVVDRLRGDGEHDVRLHWLAGDFPYEYSEADGRMSLATPEGAFTVTVLDASGAPRRGTVVAGQESPPRGWLARHYCEKIAVPSLAVEGSAELPMTTVSVLAAGTPSVVVTGDHWDVRAGGAAVTFDLSDGDLSSSSVRTSST